MTASISMNATLTTGLDVERLRSPSSKTVLVTVTGEVDASTAPRLRRVLAIATNNYRTVVLDLHDVSFFDAAGLNVLAYAIKQRRGWDTLRLQDPSKPVQRVLELSGFDRLIEIDIAPARTGTHHRDPAEINILADCAAGGTRQVFTEPICPQEKRHRMPANQHA